MELIIRKEDLRNKIYRGREVLRKRGILTVSGNGHGDLEGLFGLMLFLVNGQLKIKED